MNNSTDTYYLKDANNNPDSESVATDKFCQLLAK
jgi:hypothetical protein